eukprot:g4848.t1
MSFEPGNGVTVIGAHTDSPCPKLKPNAHVAKSGFIELGLQPYGGGLWHTWFDRDLGIAGRVIVRRGEGADARLSHELVKIDRPILRIPTLAIHLESADERKAFKVNKQKHLCAVLATEFKAQLGVEAGAGAGGGDGGGGGGEPAVKRQKPAAEPAPRPSLLLELLARELGCEPAQIADLELQLCDTQPSCLGGTRNEFVFSGRLDNLCSSFCALQALLETCSPHAGAGAPTLDAESNVRMLALFDHEEVGSTSAQGAGSTVMAEAIRRVTLALAANAGAAGECEGLVERTLRRSFLVSADMAHAQHPNYSDKHEPHHAPRLHAGQVIKTNANQRYATDAVSAFIFRTLGERVGVPVQEFVVRSDC